jgi:hypothetical protein
MIIWQRIPLLLLKTRILFYSEMQRRTIFVTLLIFILQVSYVFGQDKIQGGFKGCNVYTYEYKFGKLLPDSKTRTDYFNYNEKGFILVHESFSHSNAGNDKSTYNYDSKGNLTEEVDYFLDGSVSAKHILTYDEKRNLVKEEWLSDEVPGNKDVYVYDNKKNLIEKTHYFNNDSLVGKDVYTYFAKGKIATHTFSGSNGISKSIETCDYDYQGNLIEIDNCESQGGGCDRCLYMNSPKGLLMKIVCYRADGTIRKKEVYDYSLKGTVLLHSVYMDDGWTSELFDDDGNKVETQISYKGIISSKTLYKYDDKGNLIWEMHFDGHGLATKRIEYNFF